MKYKTAIRKLFRFVAPNWGSYIVGLLLYSAQSFLYSLFLSLMTALLSDVMIGGTSTTFVSTVAKIIPIFFCISVSIGFGIFMLFLARIKIEGRIRRTVLQNFLCSSIEDRMRYEAGISAINEEVDCACELLDNATADVLGCILSIVLSFCVLMGLSWKIGMLSILIGVISFVQHTHYVKPRKNVAEARFSINRKLVNLVTNVVQKLPSIHTYHGEEKINNRFSSLNANLLKTYLDESLVDLKQSCIGGIHNLITILCVWGVGSYLVSIGELNFSSLMIAPFMANTLANGMGGISSAFSYIQGPMVACDKLGSLLTSTPVHNRDTQLEEWKNWDGNETLYVTDLSITYHGSTKPALKHISLTFQEKNTIVVVGKSGSGKSTLLKTLVGLIERDNLPLKIGNMDYCATTPTAWRKKFAYVEQNARLLHMTITENIGLGCIGKCTPVDIELAAKEAGADLFINKLPEKYNSLCGEAGVSLSGGQKKLITLARALVRHSPILVLDEPTSSLDHDAKLMVLDTIDHLRRKSTMIISTHDLCLAKDADLVVVLSDGEIVQMGKHNDLCKSKGEYVELWKNYIDGDVI